MISQTINSNVCLATYGTLTPFRRSCVLLTIINWVFWALAKISFWTLTSKRSAFMIAVVAAVNSRALVSAAVSTRQDCDGTLGLPILLAGPMREAQGKEGGGGEGR